MRITDGSEDQRPPVEVRVRRAEAVAGAWHCLVLDPQTGAETWSFLPASHVLGLRLGRGAIVLRVVRGSETAERWGRPVRAQQGRSSTARARSSSEACV